MTLSKKVLRTIEEKNIKPVARWKFVIKNIAIWTLGALAIAVGSLAIGILFHIMRTNDWDIYAYFGKSFFAYVTSIFPYFWVVILGLFLGLSYFIVRKTKTGYRYTIHFFFATVFALSAIFGAVLFASGIGAAVDRALLERIPAYARLPHTKTEIWNSPSLGLLAGTITDVISPTAFTLQDFSGHEWLALEDDTDWRGRELRHLGATVKLMGAYENEDVFIVEEVRPWEGRVKPTKVK